MDSGPVASPPVEGRESNLNWRAFRERVEGWHWVRPALLFVITRLGIFLVAYFAASLLPPSSTPSPYHLRGTENVLLDVFGSRWDTGFYVSIVEEGYRYRGVELPSVAFFPLLPLAMRALLPIVGDAVVAGIVVGNASLLAAAVLFYRLVDEQYGTATASRAVWYLLIFPTAFFGSAIYTESLFLFTAVGAFYCARQRRWSLAGLLGLAAGLTRLVGIVVMALLVLEWLHQRRRDEYPPSLSTLPLALTPPLGTGLYMVYLWRAFGEPLAFLHASAAWERTPQPLGMAVARLFQTPAGGWWAALLAGRLPLNDFFDLGVALLFLLLAFILLYQRRWAEGMFVWLGVMISLSSGLLMSQRRYVWVLFPVFILLAQWGRRPWFDRLISALFLLGLALFTILFALGYWVG